MKPSRIAHDGSGSGLQLFEISFSSSSRNIPANNLVSGRIYVYQIRSLGGTTGKSDWSESVSHRAY
ncbi:hypothetical protein [Luteolibacter sp. AS25]|uniref:hypothetical protein n=1 Tax=Luteolibacter sp. AS25 TaxID=3135776 RepID=UPI00398A9F4A